MNPKVEAKGPSVFQTDLPMLENRFQFQRYLRDIGRTATEQLR